MATKADPRISSKTSHSILAYSHGAITGYRFFTKEDFLHMMYDMSLEDIMKDLERFKDLEEYEICTKLKSYQRTVIHSAARFDGGNMTKTTRIVLLFFCSALLLVTTKTFALNDLEQFTYDMRTETRWSARGTSP